MAAGVAEPGPHYAVKVTDLPPTSLECNCGEVFDGPDPIAQIRAHMDALNPEGGEP